MSETTATSRNRYKISLTKGQWMVSIADGAGCGLTLHEPLEEVRDAQSPRTFEFAALVTLSLHGWEQVVSDADGKSGIATPGPAAEPCYWGTRKKTGARQALRKLRGKPVETESYKGFYNS